MLLDDYAQILTHTIEQIRTPQRDKILSAARITADSLGRGGLIRVFGCGHSHILAEETFYRAGGLAASEEMPITGMPASSVILAGRSEPHLL